MATKPHLGSASLLWLLYKVPVCERSGRPEREQRELQTQQTLSPAHPAGERGRGGGAGDGGDFIPPATDRNLQDSSFFFSFHHSLPTEMHKW